MPMQRFVQLARLAVALLAVGFDPAVAVNDGRGRDWRPLGATMPNSGRPTWEQVAAVCPTDGVTPCSARLGNIEMKDWVWATAPQVLELFGSHAPAILASPNGSVGGFEYMAAAAQFQAAFGITAHFQGCPTYQPCFNVKFSTGMTASVVGAGSPAVPIGGEVSLDLEWSSGGFRIFSPLHPDMGRGLWMWRPTGHGTPAVHAYDDAATLPKPGGGVAVANVLANDFVSGQTATLQTVSLAMVSSSAAGIWLDGGDGSVRVANGLAAGTYTLVYRICNLASPDQCDDATVTVTLKSFPIVARSDLGAVSFGAGGRAISNVLANDSLGAEVPTTALVRLTQVSSTHAGVSLNTATGAVDVAPGTPHGNHALVYAICELANLANCAQATASVVPYTIDAVDDAARGSSKTGGVVIASVLANDWFNGARATTGQVAISLPAPLPKGITLNLATGAVSVTPKTESGTYRFAYRICEIRSPANCDQAWVTLDLSGRDR